MKSAMRMIGSLVAIGTFLLVALVAVPAAASGATGNQICYPTAVEYGCGIF
jgi:hypothetical protein